MIERLNRTYKASYRITNGFDNIDGANYDLALWVAYYNFLRPHKHNNYRVLNKVEHLENADNMLGQVADAHLPWPADNPADAEVGEQGFSLFLDLEPEITTQPSRRDLPLMAHKSNATMLLPRWRNQPVPEFFAVDKVLRALFCVLSRVA